MSLRQTIYMLSGTLRRLFFVVLLACVLGTIYYTQRLVNELRKESRQIVEFYSQTYQLIVQTENMEVLDWFLANNILQKMDFPLIMIDNHGNISSWRGIGVPEEDRSPQAMEKAKKIFAKIKDQNEPVRYMYNGEVFQSIYYGDSRLITRLELLPYLTFSGTGLLILIAFIGFNNIKKSEQRFIWVGMAKETAHQLGTPISSLLGWLELMKTGDMSPDKINRLAQDMEMDVRRLEKIAARFSKIGSATNLEKQDVHQVLREVAAYFRKRLPQAGREIRLVEDYGDLPLVRLNRELFEWAVENLIKNAIDAVQGKNGVIEIVTGRLADSKRVFIEIRDNGCGITAKRRDDVFKAGYSTKKRGWGLGLNFGKRIIEEYHGGKLYIKESHAGRGTVMRIVL
ncbi:MAG TPA: HAMP domain-containing sensor histidine kinase [bacterium]|nr:HAMP domain-containing sensor histidine kinase [bacterium]HPN33797.1 HAMP domain-containing sensor histidine kinase [bacterium]